MTDEQKAAYVNAQAVAAQCELQAMLARNRQLESAGSSPEYNEKDIRDIPDRFGISHYLVTELFKSRV